AGDWSSDVCSCALPRRHRLPLRAQGAPISSRRLRLRNPAKPQAAATAMLFHTWVFFVFFLIVYPVHLLVRKNNQLMNLWLMVASYTIYGWGDFLSLLSVFVTAAHV